MEREGRLLLLWLVSFLRRPYYLWAWHRLQNTDKLGICLRHRESLALGCTEEPHVSSSVPNVISKNSTKPNQRPKAQLGVSKQTSQHILQETLCLSAQERLIILTEFQGQNLSTRIGGKDGRKGNRCTHLLCFLSMSRLKVKRCSCYLIFRCVASVELVIASENVVRPAKKEIAIYSRARFVHCTRVVVVLNEGMAWVKWIVRWNLALFMGVGYTFSCQEFNICLDRIVEKLFFRGLP